MFFLKKEIIVNTILRFLGIGSVVWLLNIFNGSDLTSLWGEIVLILTYATIFNMIAQFGQGMYILDSQKTDETTLWRIQVNTLTISFILFLLTFLINKFEFNEYVLGAAMSVFTGWFLNRKFFYQKEKNRPLLFSILNSNNYINFLLLAVVGLLYNNGNLLDSKEYLIYGLFVVFLVSIIIKLRYFPLEDFSFQKQLSILRGSFPFLLVTSGLVILSWMDTLMLDFYTDSFEVGIYNTVFKACSLLAIGLSILNAYVAPRIRNTYNDSIEKLKKLVRPFNRLGLISGISVLVVFWLFPEVVFRILGLEPLPSYVTLLLVMSVGYVVNASSGNVGLLLQLTGHKRTFNLAILVALGLNLILNTILIPKHGALGAGIASSASMITWNWISVIMVKRIHGFWSI